MEMAGKQRRRLWKRYYYNNPAPIAIGDCNQ
jgi:hypothetical protein